MIPCMDTMAYEIYKELQSRDSWMYPYQRTPLWEIAIYKPYSSWIFMGKVIPKNPYVEHNKYHGSTLLGVHPIVP